MTTRPRHTTRMVVGSETPRNDHPTTWPSHKIWKVVRWSAGHLVIWGCFGPDQHSLCGVPSGGSWSRGQVVRWSSRGVWEPATFRVLCLGRVVTWSGGHPGVFGSRPPSGSYDLVGWSRGRVVIRGCLGADHRAGTSFLESHQLGGQVVGWSGGSGPLSPHGPLSPQGPMMWGSRY